MLPYDVADQINAGIISDEVVGRANSGSMIRRITYLVPESHEIMTFFTNAFDGIPPGVIVYLHKRRWDIEKIFDTLKHSYYKKSMGTWSCRKNHAGQFYLPATQPRLFI